jgi:hypothetical protein
VAGAAVVGGGQELARAVGDCTMPNPGQFALPGNVMLNATDVAEDVPESLKRQRVPFPINCLIVPS